MNPSPNVKHVFFYKLEEREGIQAERDYRVKEFDAVFCFQNVL